MRDNKWLMILFASTLLALVVCQIKTCSSNKVKSTDIDSLNVSMNKKIDSLNFNAKWNMKLQEDFVKQYKESKKSEQPIINHYNTYYGKINNATDSVLLIAIDSLLTEHRKTPVARYY